MVDRLTNLKSNLEEANWLRSKTYHWESNSSSKNTLKLNEIIKFSVYLHYILYLRMELLFWQE